MVASVSQAVPFPSKLKIFSDFDGTISSVDSLKLLLNKTASPEWKKIEADLGAGRTDERDGLQKIFDLVQVPFADAQKLVLDKVHIDPGFKVFAEWARANDHDISILSGGFESFIRPLLSNASIRDVPVLANEVQVKDCQWRVVPNSKISRLCPYCNHCKSASLLNAKSKNKDAFIVYIGDGHTDACPVQLADLVFAKGYLQDYCRVRAIPFVAFENFSQILQYLSDWQNAQVSDYFQARVASSH